MSFLLFVLCMYCVMSAADLTRFVTENRFSELPPAGPMPVAFYVLTFPAGIAVLALPIYGFFALPWWQVILGFLLGTMGTAVVTRLAIRNWHYLWAMAFSVSAIIVFIVATVRRN